MNVNISPSPTLVELNESTARGAIFCVHPAGGGLRPFEILAKKLKHLAKVYGLEDPSIYADEDFSSLPELAELHIQVIRSVQPSGPYVLFGSCSGGPFAYEIAYQLSLEGEKTTRVVMFGSHGIVGFDPAVKEQYLFLHSYLQRRFDLNIDDLDWHGFESMDRATVCSTIVDALVIREMLPPNMDTRWIRKSLESLCMTRLATKHYRAPKSALDIDLFKQPRGESSKERGQQDWCDWNNLTKGSLNIFEHEIHLGPDDDILAEPHVNWVVAELQRTSLSTYS